MRLQEPLNTEERYLHGINVRLNILIEMFSSFLNVYAKKEEVPTSNNEVVEEVTVTLDEDTVEEKEKTVFEEFTKKELVELLNDFDIECNDRMLKSELVELAEKNL